VPTLSGKYAHIFGILEICFVTIFTIEYLLRLWASVPEKMTFNKFVFDPMNIIDVLSILPFFIDLLFMYLAKESDFTVDLRVLRALRLMRVFKIGRYSTQLKLIGGAMARSLGSLVMLGLCMIFALIIFSTMIFLVERGIWDAEMACYVRTGDRAGSLGGLCSPFQSIPEASWWAITTMTTVGYGDTYPITNWGRFIGGLTMIIGILCVALPTTVLGVQFSDAFAAVTEEKAIADLKEKFPEKEQVTLELKAGLAHLEELQQKLITLLPEIERQLLKVTADDKSRNVAVKASFSHLSDSSVQAMSNAKTFLTATLPEPFS
jgi:voltage-gated potassium channel